MTKRKYGLLLAIGTSALVLMGGCETLANITGKGDEWRKKNNEKAVDDAERLLNGGEEMADNTADTSANEAASSVEQPLMAQLRRNKQQCEKLRESIAQTRSRIKDLERQLDAEQNSLARSTKKVEVTQRVVNMIRMGEMEQLNGNKFSASSDSRNTLTPSRLDVGGPAISTAVPQDGYGRTDGINLHRNELSFDTPAEAKDVFGPLDLTPKKVQKSAPAAEVGVQWDEKLGGTGVGNAPDARVITVEGQGSDSEVVLNVGSVNGVSVGMLYEGKDDMGNTVILNLDEVHRANSIATPHPGHVPSGMMIKGSGLKRIYSLPK